MPTTARSNAVASGVQRRAETPSQPSWVADRGVPAPIPSLTGGHGEPAATQPPSSTSRTVADRGVDLEHLVEQVVEALEDRVLGELERRGGRFLGAF